MNEANQQASSSVQERPAQTPVRRPRAAEAILRWRNAIGAANVDDAAGAPERYGNCTTGLERRIAAALRPASRADVPALLAIARDCAVPVYPISTGRNWGYGTALPPGHDCAILDLSRLDTIRAVDPDLGLFEVEPGVTQGALAAWLDEQNLDFMVPTTGAGPDASLLGNALERGYGITPIADHFSAVMRIEAVLPDGRVYVPSLSAFGTELADHAFKYGPGPYLDGLFTQSNLGVVTAMTLVLARRPERVEAFYFAVPDVASFQAVAGAVRGILQELGSVSGSVNLMNRHRVLAMMAPYEADRLGADGLLSAEAIALLGRRYRVDPWMGMGALYGPPEVVAAGRRLVRRRLKDITRRLAFMTTPRARLLRGATSRVLGKGHGVPTMLSRVAESLEILEGRPNRVAHPLVYWQRPGQVDTLSALDPARDGCGLIWYAPLVPFKPELIERYVERCSEVLRAHRMEPLITLSTLSSSCVDSSVPLLFDAGKPEDVERAHRCYDALLEAGRELGVAPYRLHVGAMDRFVDPANPCWDLVGRLKRAIDPDDIVSPGRYAPRMADFDAQAGAGPGTAGAPPMPEVEAVAGPAADGSGSSASPVQAAELARSDGSNVQGATPIGLTARFGGDFFDYFSLELADTEERLTESHRLRYRVYVDEMKFERREDFPCGLEHDAFDPRSLTMLLRHKESRRAVGCVRLIVADPADPAQRFPFEHAAGDALPARSNVFRTTPRDRLGEVSRLAIAAEFRRRRNDQEMGLYSVQDAMISPDPRRRNIPPALGLVFASAWMGMEIGLDAVFVMMELRLARLLRTLGLGFEQVGEAIEYHGLRAPFVITRESLSGDVAPPLRSALALVRERTTALSRLDTPLLRAVRKSHELRRTGSA